MGQLIMRDLKTISEALVMLDRMGLVIWSGYLLEDSFPENYTLGQMRDEFKKVRKKIEKIMAELKR